MAVGRNGASRWDSALTVAERDAGLGLHPVWYIVVDCAALTPIRCVGLAPIHDPRRLRVAPRAQAWPWIYLVARENVTYLYEAADEAGGVDEHHAVLLAVDLRDLAPRRIRPDELEWTEITGPTFDPADHGITPDRPGPGQSRADWAAEVQLGAQPEVSALALADGRIAVRGHLEPSRVTVVEPYPGLGLQRWEREHLDARPDIG